MDLTERLIVDAARAGHRPADLHRRRPGDRPDPAVAAPPTCSTGWRRWSAGALHPDRSGGGRACGVPTPTSVDYLPEWGSGKLIFELYDTVLLPTVVDPVFVVGFPVEVSPLARQHRRTTRPSPTGSSWPSTPRSSPTATASSTSPRSSRSASGREAEAVARGDLEAHPADLAFVRALEYGLPPDVGHRHRGGPPGHAAGRGRGHPGRHPLPHAAPGGAELTDGGRRRPVARRTRPPDADPLTGAGDGPCPASSTIAEAIEIELPAGGRTVVVSDLHLPVGGHRDVERPWPRNWPTLLAGMAGPATFVIAGDGFEMLAGPPEVEPDPRRPPPVHRGGGRLRRRRRPPGGGPVGQPRRPAGLGQRPRSRVLRERLGVDYFALDLDLVGGHRPRTAAGAGGPRQPGRSVQRLRGPLVARWTPRSGTTSSATSCPSWSPGSHRAPSSRACSGSTATPPTSSGHGSSTGRSSGSCGWPPCPSWPSCCCGSWPSSPASDRSSTTTPSGGCSASGCWWPSSCVVAGGGGGGHPAAGQPGPARVIGQRPFRPGQPQRSGPGRGRPPGHPGVRRDDLGPHPRARAVRGRATASTPTRAAGPPR